jgi:hypothetical protein
MRIFPVVGQFIEDKFRVIKYMYVKTLEAKQCTPFGFESVPIKGVRAVVFNNDVIVGYLQKAFEELKEGESVVFSQKEDGTIAASIKNLNNGHIQINGTGDFAVRFNELEKGYNDLKSDMNSFITQTYNLHTHPFTGGTTSATTTLGTASTASIADSKVETVELPSK